MTRGDLIGAALIAASDGQLAQALQVLIRTSTAEGRDVVAQAAREALDRHLPDLVERAAGSSQAGAELSESLGAAVILLQPEIGAVAAMTGLPAATGPVTGLVTQVLLVAAVALENAAADDGDDRLYERAEAHGGLASIFTAAGQRDRAVAAGRRAVEIRRRLVERHGNEQIEGLALALNNLSVSLDGTGQTEESLAASEEATALLRRLAEAGGAAYLPSLASALANLSADLAAAGRNDEALASAQEAASTWRMLACAGAEVQQAELARVLHNLSVRLASCGRDAEAVQAIGEAIRIRRHLPEPGQEHSRAGLASSLTSYSSRLNAVGRYAEALAATEEAIQIRRDLAAADPGRYLPALATSLNNLSVDLAQAAGRPATQALSATAEAVRIRRDLARTEPDRFRPALAAALHNMSADLAATGQDSHALEVIQEAVAIRRSLATARPGRYDADLASSLRNLSIRLAADGRPAEAVDAASESAGLLRSLAERRPGVFLADFAASLGTLSTRLGAAGRDQDALAAAEECVRLRRELAATVPGAYRPALATALNNLSVSLSRSGRTREALAAAEEAVQIRRALASGQPARFAAGLATSLNNLAVDLGDAGRHQEALAALQETVRQLRPLVASDPRRFLPDLVMSVSNLSEQLAAVGRHDEAGRAFARLLAEHQGDAWATGTILLGRGMRAAECGDVTMAVAGARDAIDLLQADALAQARARRFLRELRRADPGGFDQTWDSARGSLPAWLRHLDHDRLVDEQTRRWINCPTLEEEEAFLAANAVLVSEEVEALLDHLIDGSPGSRWLRMHRDIVRAARATSVGDAYAQHRAMLWREGTAKALAAWIAADRDDLRGVLAEERVLLLSEEAAGQAEEILMTAARTPELIWRMGLLGLCRSDGVEAAFRISADPATLLRLPGKRALTEFGPRRLALARIRAGRDPDDSEGAFIHAVLALAGGLACEADEAIARCAGTSTSWDRRIGAGYLTELMAIRPDLTDGLARLRSIMASSEADGVRMEPGAAS